MIWLEAIDPTQRALYDELLGDAPSPVPVSGGYDEFTDVALGSYHGDWQMAIDWPSSPLSGANLTALAGVPQLIQPYAAALNPDRILATLGTHPVTTIFFFDGDNLGYQIDRGFGAAYDFDDLRGHRAAWTVNPALADLAPFVWNDYIDGAHTRSAWGTSRLRRAAESPAPVCPRGSVQVIGPSHRLDECDRTYL